MTLIVTEKDPDRIVMGADSALGAADEVYTCPNTQKIFRADSYLVGVCGSTRISQILQFMRWPNPPDAIDDPFIVRNIVPAIREAAHDGGALLNGHAVLGERTVITVAVHGEIIVLGCDLAMVRLNGPVCIGSGRHAAYATMRALKAAGVEPARRRIELTLEAVAEYSLYVRPPFRVLELV